MNTLGDIEVGREALAAELQAIESGEYGEEERNASTQTESLSLQIPDSVWNGIETEVVDFLDEQLNIAESERGDLMKNFARWKEAYLAPVPGEPKNFPIANASNLTVPVIKEIVNTICAQLVQATLTNRPYWILTDLAPEWEPFVDDLQTFFDLSGDRELKLNETAVSWILEMCKLGTGILEVGYEVTDELRFKYKSDGRGYTETVETVKDGPVSYHIPLQRFWIRLSETDLQKARWVAKEIELSWREIYEKKEQGKFYDIDRIWQQEDQIQEDQVREVEEALTATQPQDRDLFRIFEVWLKWPIKGKDGKKRYAELRLFYERNTRTVLGRTWHPYWHGKRPFVKIGYMPVEHRFYSMGLCEMLEQIQLMISTKHNQRSDNATLANLKMIIKRKMARGLKPGDPLYSGKIIEVNDIWNDMREFQLGEIYPSTVNEENILRDYANRLSGVNDAIFGSAMPVTRTTAAAQLALLQEQAKRIDLTVRSIRQGLDRVGELQAELYFQFGSNKKGVAWMGKRGLRADAVFSLPRKVIEVGTGIRVSSPTSVHNKQVKRENALAMFNLTVQLYQQILPLAQGLAPDALPVVISEMVAGAQKFMRDVLETFEVSDPDQVLAGLAVLERVLPRAEDLGGIGAFEGREESSEILRQLSGLEGILREAGGPKDRSTRLPPERNQPGRRPLEERVPGGGSPSIPLGGDFIIQ